MGVPINSNPELETAPDLDTWRARVMAAGMRWWIEQAKAKWHAAQKARNVD